MDETVKFLGKDCIVTRRSDRSEKIVMSKGDFTDIMAEKGVTKEVLEVVRKADDEITAEALKFQADRLIKANKGLKEDDPKYTTKSCLVLGAGTGALEYELIPHKVHSGMDPRTKQPYTSEKYGVCRVTKVYNLNRDLRKEGGLMDEISSMFEKSLKK